MEIASKYKEAVTKPIRRKPGKHLKTYSYLQLKKYVEQQR